MRVRVTAAFALFIAAWLWIDARAQTNAPIVSGAHRFEKVTDGVYYATASGTMTVGANSPIIVTDTEAIVIDSEITPAAARALIADIKAITDKPVKYVIDSHYHYDHAFGNQVFGPDVQVIGHENTRKRLLTNVLEQYTYQVSLNPQRAETLRQRIAAEKDPAQKAPLERALANQLAYLDQVKEIKVTPPTVTLDKKMTLYRGGREIQILYFGRGHTDTDVVVYLPKEKIVCTGDLMESVVSYMGDAYADEWSATLDRLMTLDFDTVLPGHGVVFKGKAHIQAFQRYVNSLLKQTMDLKKQGVAADAAAPRIDMTAFAPDFPQLRAPGVDVAAVRRIYALADHPEPAH
jgi:glyoxylase-like metal-dependent hydrolase (beta-lactamase superfamily II)